MYWQSTFSQGGTAILIFCLINGAKIKKNKIKAKCRGEVYMYCIFIVFETIKAYSVCMCSAEWDTTVLNWGPGGKDGHSPAQRDFSIQYKADNAQDKCDCYE